MVEKVAARFKGGPFDGKTLVAELSWPLPDIFDEVNEPFLFGLGGQYRKIRQSQLEAPVSDFLVRGAEYEWEPSKPS